MIGDKKEAPRLVTRYIGELIRNQVELPQATAVLDEPDSENMLLADVSQLAPEPAPQNSFKEKMKQRLALEHQHEERVQVSRAGVERISVNARQLAQHVDEFISSLRVTAKQADDNPQLLRRLEQLRRLSANFIRALEHQLPGYATALFVEQTGE